MPWASLPPVVVSAPFSAPESAKDEETVNVSLARCATHWRGWRCRLKSASVFKTVGVRRVVCCVCLCVCACNWGSRFLQKSRELGSELHVSCETMSLDPPPHSWKSTLRWKAAKLCEADFFSHCLLHVTHYHLMLVDLTESNG